MIHLDWQTEEEDGWETEKEPPRPEHNNRRESWRLLLVILLLLFATLLITGRQVGLQVKQVQQNTHEAILATHRLVLQAAAENDAELFVNLISKDDVWWVDAQKQLIMEGGLTDREPLGLVQMEPAGDATVTALSPELNKAEVAFTVPYVVNRPEGYTETISLLQTMSYVQEEGNWLYTRPDTTTWGEWQTIEQDNISVTYRDIEGDLGRRLAEDLIQSVLEMCQYTGACPLHTQLIIRLEESLNGLPQVSRSIHPAESRISLGLPTPRLVGIPQDEIGYQALRRGYARHILGFLIVRWEAPDIQAGMETYHDALLRRRFEDLGLAGLPVPGQPASEAPPYPLPGQNIATICVAEPGQGSELLVYDAQEGNWPISMSGGPLTRLAPLPDDSGVLIQEIDDAGLDNQHLLLWRPGDPQIDLGKSIGLTFDRGGSGGIIHILDRDYGWGAFHLADFAKCTPAGCKLQPAPYLDNQWSPDSRYLLYLEEAGDRYYLQDNETGARRVLTSALSAFWADEETIALVRSENPSRSSWRISLFDIPRGEQRDLVSQAALLAEIPGTLHPAEELLVVHDVLAWPGRADTFLVVAYREDPLSSFYPAMAAIHIFAVQTGPVSQVKWLSTLEGQTVSKLELSPNGRWVNLTSYLPAEPATRILLIDLETERMQEYTFAHDRPDVVAGYDWSADGNWLVAANRGLLTLIAPGTAYQQTITPPSAGCAFAAWLNQ